MSRPVAGPPRTKTGLRLLKHLNNPAVQSALAELLDGMRPNHRSYVAVERLLGDNAQRIRAIEDEAIEWASPVAKAAPPTDFGEQTITSGRLPKDLADAIQTTRTEGRPSWRDQVG